MLTQAEINVLLDVLKRMRSNQLSFPEWGQTRSYEAVSADKKHKHRFVIDVNRKGHFNPQKYTFQERLSSTEDILLRLDSAGRPHTNPNGDEIPCPHIHIIREGYGASWAYPVPETINMEQDLLGVFIDFLNYCKIKDTEKITYKHQGGLDL